MNLTFPQMPPNWKFTPLTPTYQPPLPMDPLQLQMQQIMALRYNATLMQPGNGTFIMPHVRPLLLQLDSYHDLAPGRRRHKTAASCKNQIIHAPFSMIKSDHCTVSHHSWVGDAKNARSGSAGRPPSSGLSTTPNHKSRSRAVLQNRSKRASAIKGQRKCDDLLQYAVAVEGAECGRPWKRRRMNRQSTDNIPVQIASRSLTRASTSNSCSG